MHVVTYTCVCIYIYICVCTGLNKVLQMHLNVNVFPLRYPYAGTTLSSVYVLSSEPLTTHMSM